MTVARVLEVLARDPLAAAGASEIADALDLPRRQVALHLKGLADAGWTRQLPNRKWQLTPRPVRIADRVRAALAAQRAHWLGLEEAAKATATADKLLPPDPKPSGG